MKFTGKETFAAVANRSFSGTIWGPYGEKLIFVGVAVMPEGCSFWQRGFDLWDEPLSDC